MFLPYKTVDCVLKHRDAVEQEQVGRWLRKVLGASV